MEDGPEAKIEPSALRSGVPGERVDYYESRGTQSMKRQNEQHP